MSNLIVGKTASENMRPVLVTSEGKLVTSPVIDLAGSEEIVPVNSLLSGAAVGTPSRLSSVDNTFIEGVTIYGFKSFASGIPTANTGEIYIGFGNTQLPEKVVPGGATNIIATPGNKLDLYDWFYGITQAGDALFLRYWIKALPGDEVTPTQLLVTANANTITQITATADTFFQRATIIGVKSFSGAGVPTANVGNVYFGKGNTQLPDEIIPGTGIVLEAREGTKFDLSDFYFVTLNNADGILVTYW